MRNAAGHRAVGAYRLYFGAIEYDIGQELV